MCKLSSQALPCATLNIILVNNYTFQELGIMLTISRRGTVLGF